MKTSPTQPQPAHLFDTNVFVDFLRGPNYQFYPSAAPFILDVINQKASGAISVLTDYELWCGIRSNTEEKQIKAILVHFRRLPFTVAIARRAGYLYKTFLTTKQLKEDVGSPDLFLTATAEYYKYPILTRNIKHFSLFTSLIDVVSY